MKWPLVSRRAYDQIADERDRLRQRNDELQDQLIRIARRNNRMSETTPKPRERKSREKIPDEVKAEIEAWDSPATQSLLKTRARQLFDEHKNWNAVRDALKVEAGS